MRQYKDFQIPEGEEEEYALRMPSGKRGWSLEDMRIGGMITNFQVGRERNGREGRMGERIRGNLKEEGWEGCQERSQIGQQFPGHLQGNDNCSAPNPYMRFLFRILERLHALHPAENTYVSLTSDSLYTSLQV